MDDDQLARLVSEVEGWESLPLAERNEKMRAMLDGLSAEDKTRLVSAAELQLGAPESVAWALAADLPELLEAGSRVLHTVAMMDEPVRMLEVLDILGASQPRELVAACFSVLVLSRDPVELPPAVAAVRRDFDSRRGE